MPAALTVGGSLPVFIKIKEEPDFSDSSKYVSANTYPNC